jgi:hypothetical protein
VTPLHPAEQVKRIRTLVHSDPRAAGLRVVQTNDGNFTLYDSTGKQLSTPQPFHLRAFTSRGWHEQPSTPGQKAPLLRLASELLDEAQAELDMEDRVDRLLGYDEGSTR